jgi:alkanesulfonate monooxygenase SsuD/methylene tetrahydromethanopterin reductase-like flavin-dependent oxidoreductase (luciferase family)
MKFGNVIPYDFPSFQNILEQAKKSEESGFDSILYPDHTVDWNPDNAICFEAFNTLSALAMKTKLKLGTAVSDCHRYHPALMAQKVATLDHISSGRALLGIGVGEKINVDMYGLSRAKALSKLREYIDLLRQFWSKKKVTKNSEFWGDIKGAFIQIKPIQNTPPIYVAANGPKSRQLTGELANGWIPFIETPRTYKENKKEIVDAAKKVGRNPEEIDYALQTYVAIDDDNPEKAVKTCEAFKSFSLLVASTKLNQIYPTLNLPTELTVFNYDWNSDVHKLLAYQDKLPESMLTDILCLGTTEDVITYIEKFKEAGVSHMAFFNHGPDLNKVYESFRDKIIPYFKEEDK